jgi:DNA-binding LacI/PurR family transcriptional regulator
MPDRRPTQKDVALLAGVTRGTVSLVMSGQGNSRVPISAETCQRVLKAAQQLGYSPNPAAQMLASGSSMIMGVFTYEPEFPLENEDHHYPYLLGIEREAGRCEYDVLLFTRVRNTPRHSIYTGGANSMRLAAGAVLLGLNPERAELRALVEENYPFVYIGRREVPGCEIDWVVSDYISSSAEAASHLLSLGHRRLAFVDHRAGTEASQDKLAGCQRAVAAVDGAQLLVLDHELVERGEVVRALRQHGITALLARDMFVMRALLEELNEAGMGVPADVSVLALAGGSPSLLPGIRPSRVRIDRERVGELAVQVLINRIQNRMSPPQHILVECGFIAGETTARPGAGQVAMPEGGDEGTVAVKTT